MRTKKDTKSKEKQRAVYHFKYEESSSKSFSEINLEASFIQSSICSARDKKTFKLATKTETIPDVFRIAIWSLQIKAAKYKALLALANGGGWSQNKKNPSPHTYNNMEYIVQCA